MPSLPELRYFSLPGRVRLMLFWLIGCWLGLCLTAPAHAAQKVTLQLKWLHQFQFAGYYAAVEKGYYREVGLDVTLKEARPGYDEQEEVLQGRAQFGVANSSLILQRGRGKPVVVLASIFQHSPDVLLVRKVNGPQRIEQLIGKKVMLAQHNEELLAYFKKLNIPFDALQRVEHSFQPQDLINGRVDAMSAYVTDAMYHLDKLGLTYLVYSPRTVGLDFYGDNLFTTEQELRQHPQRVRDFRAASLRGWEYAMQHPEEIIELILRKYPTRLTREHLMYEAQQMVPLLQANLIEMGYMNPLRWKQIAAAYADLGMLRQDFPLDGFLYEEIAPPASNWLFAGLAAAVLLIILTGSLSLRYAHAARRLRRERRARQLAQEKLRENEERITLALHGAGDGVWDWDNQTGQVVYSKSYKEMLGYAEDEFADRPEEWKNCVHPDDKAEMAAGIRRYFFCQPDPITGREPSIVSEYRMRCKDGSWKWMMSRGNVVARDADGKPLRMTGTLSDVTQRKEAELEQLQHLLEASPDAMLLTDAAGEIRYLNQAVETLFGWSRQQLLGQQVEMLVPLSVREEHALLRTNFIAHGSAEGKLKMKRQLAGLRRDGIELPIEVSLSALVITGQTMIVATIRDMSERKLAEANLRSSEERYRQIVETAAEGIWILDQQGQTVFVNPRLPVMLGYPAEHILGRPLTDFMDEEGMSLAQQFLHNVEESTTKRFDLKFCRADQSVMWASMAVSLIRDTSGKMNGAMAMITDVTERHEAVAALTANNQRLEFIFNAVNSAVILQDVAGHILMRNRAANTMFGLDKRDTMPTDCLWRSENGALLAADEIPFARVVASGEAIRDAVIGISQPDGSMRWLSVNSEPIGKRGTQLSQIICSYTDITESKRAADLLRQSEERLQEIIEAIPVAIFIKDAASRFLLINHAAENQFGVRLVNLHGNQGSEYFLAREHAAQLANDQRAWDNRVLLEQEETLWHVGKKENRHIRTYRKPVFEASGQPAYLICVSVDVTENKRAEKALIELNEHLEERVNERTRQLDYAKQQAEEANRYKGQFLANMSHEIRTPMNGVIGMAYLAMQTELTAKQRDYIEKIHHAGEHLLGIIDDILDFSKIEAGKLELEKIEFTLEQVLQNLSNMVAARATSKGLLLVMEVDQNLPTKLVGDPLRLGQILINLVNNAIKFSSQGEIRVALQQIETDQSTCTMRVIVQDQGIGIGEDGMQKLFHSFQQADTSTTREYGGTGLGLVICKQLVQLMGGEIGVESEPGEGSRFWFTACLGLPGEGNADPHSARLEMRRLATLNLRQRHILLVEDNPFNQQIACEILQQAQALVDVANHGQEALDKLQNHTYDCVLMDVQMPVMDGLQACRLIRQKDEWKNLCVIAMTANATVQDREICMEVGMSDFVTKPIQPGQLYRVLSKWLPALPEPQSLEVADLLPDLPNDSEIIDLSLLVNLVGSGGDKIRKFSHEFLRSTEQGLRELQAALDAGEIGQCAELAHRMKSASKTVGALGFARLCQQMETQAPEVSPQQLAAWFAQMQSLLQRIREEIQRRPHLAMV